MKVLAVGAAGANAGLVTRALAKHGVQVRGLVHTSGAEQRARDNGADEVAVADLADRSALARALNGVDGVFHILPAFIGEDAPEGVELVHAAADAGITRFVFSSVYHPTLTGLSNHREKQPVESALYESDLPFVVLQPSVFMSQLDALVDMARTDGVLTGPWSAEARIAYVDYRDVAQVVTQAFLTDNLIGGTFELSGPGTYTRQDLAKELERLLKRPVRATATTPHPPPGDLPEPVREGLGRMFEHYDRTGLPGGNAYVLRSLLPHEPTSVPRYLTEAVAR